MAHDGESSALAVALLTWALLLNGTRSVVNIVIVCSCRQPKRAGVYLMGTGGQIPPHSVTYMETACSYVEPFVMHPFAFRTHAHIHGRSLSGVSVYTIQDHAGKRNNSPVYSAR
jgi:Copper type II ascorbate-dependent monooxygenase, C-terminal domain